MIRKLGSLVFLVGLAGCQPGIDSPHGFSLPEGDPSAGETAFKQYGCINCHVVEGLAVDESHIYILPSPVELGSRQSTVKTYGQLVTSIINPSHKLAPRLPVSQTSVDGVSKMANLNDSLTVTDLVNIVSYLQPKFDVSPIGISEYRRYELRQPTQDN